MKNEDKSQSFINKVIISFMLFSLFLLIFVGIIGPVSEKLHNQTKKIYLSNELTKIPNEMKNGNYEGIDTDELLGENCFFYVYNEELELVYRKYYWVRDYNLTKEEIELIPYDDNKPITNREEYIKLNDENITFLEFDYYDNMFATESAYYMLDDELNRIETDADTDRKSFNEKEIALLTGNYINQYKVSKLEFINNQEDTYTVVLFRNNNFANQIGSKYEGDETIRNILLIILFISATIIHIVKLYKIINKPLTILNDGIDMLKEGNRGEIIEYKGTEEFENVFENFNNMAIKLDEAEKRKNKAENLNRKIIADISHDLKTPITVINGYISAILDNRIEIKKQHEYLTRIQNKTYDMSILVETLNEYGKLNHPDFKLNLEYRDIGESAREYFYEKQDELELFNYKTDINIPTNKIFCIYDEFQIKRVIDNIINNTLKYTEQMTCVIFELEEDEEFAIMRIGDDGPGISKELREIMFEPFSMGDESRYGGSGLGMAIVKLIIDSHNGDINILELQKSGLIYEIKIPKRVLE